MDDGFECVSKHASDHRADGDDDGEQPLAKKKPSTDCGPFDDCDEVASSPHGKDEEDDFNVALKAFRAHDYTNARRLFFAMLQAHPDGRHPDDAYFYFGKMFEDEGLQDPTKLPLAAQSFEQVLMYPTSSQQGAALVELMRVYGLMHDTAKMQLTLQRLKVLQPSPTPAPSVPSGKPVPTPKVRMQTVPVP